MKTSLGDVEGRGRKERNMRDQQIVRDIADRSEAVFGRSGSTAPYPLFVKSPPSFPLTRRSHQLENSRTLAPALGDVAELKLQIDGLPIVLVFPIEKSVQKMPGIGPCDRDVQSLVSSAIEKIVDWLRESGGRVGPSPLNLALTGTDINSMSAVVAGPASSQTVLHVGPLELNLLDRTATRGDRAIDLRPREFRLLRYMMERSDTLLTRAKLLQEVWNYKFTPQTNLVDVHMGRLRRKIDGPGEPVMIRSVRGAGFVLSANPPSRN